MLKECFDALYNNKFGDTKFIHDYISGLENGGDYYLACHDFDEYVRTQDKIDVEYQKKDTWDWKCIENICHMGFFSSDRSIQNYADNIWQIKPLEVPEVSTLKEGHYVSTSNLVLSEDKK